MRHIAAALMIAGALGSSAAMAEDASDDGFNLMEEGAKLFFKGILQEMEPALDEMEQFAEDMEPALRGFALSMGPALRDLMDKVDDWTLYHAPEILPNGDIIMRRKAEAPEVEELGPSGEIDL